MKIILRNAIFTAVSIVLILVIFETIMYTGGCIVAMRYGMHSEPSGYVILAIGESTTYGLGVDSNDAFPSQLTEMLKKRYPDVEFTLINKGVPGQTSTAILRHINQYMIQYKPDLVISTFGTVDFNPYHNGFASKQNNWMSHLRIYKIIRVFTDFVYNYKKIRIQQGVWIYHDTHAQPPSDWYTEDIASQLYANYNSIISVVNNNNATIIMTSYLHRPEFENTLYEKIARDNQAYYVDVFVENRTDDMFTADRWHPSKKGHKIMADKIFDKIVAWDILNEWSARSNT